MQARMDLLVIDDTYIYRVGAKLAHEQPVIGLERLLLIAEKLNAKHVWVLANTDASRNASIPLDGLQGWSLRHMDSGGHMAWVSAVRNDARFETDRIQIGFAEYAPWPWDRKDDPRTTLATICYSEDALGVPLEWTSAHVALDVIRDRNRDRWAWFAPMTVDLEATIGGGWRYGQTCKELHWCGPAPAGRVVVKLDGNSDYGAGMTGLNVGQGNPTYAEPGPDCEHDWAGEGDPRRWTGCFDNKRPGFWAVEVFERDSLWDGKRLPKFDNYSWMTTDMIRQLRQAGHHIIVKLGWYWKEYHQTLRSTISNEKKNGLWDLRLAWRALREKSPAHENVYETISAVLHTVHGKLGDDDLGKTAKRFYRPDIYAMVVAMALARRVYRIEKIYREFGILPSRIDVDALWYGLDDPRQLDSILSADKLGGLKHVYTIELTDDLRTEWSSYTVARLNKLAK